MGAYNVCVLQVEWLPLWHQRTRSVPTGAPGATAYRNALVKAGFVAQAFIES